MTFANICAAQDLMVLLDGEPIDDQAGTNVARALQTTCVPKPSRDEADWRDGGVVTSAGEPLGAPTRMFVCGGGSYYQKHVAWLEAGGYTKVVDTSTASDYSYSRRGGPKLVTEPFDNFNGTFDYFVIELVRVGPTKPMSLLVNGFWGYGTQAAAAFFADQLLPTRATHVNSWLVVKWTDMNGNKVPDGADSYVIVASGN
jgi:hypothetical protein